MRWHGIVRTVVSLLLAAGVMAASTAAAEEVAPRPGDTVEWYVVQTGDTLEGLTGRFLGDARLWRENWRLNPQVENPNLLRPGERLRIIIDRKLPERSAEIEKIERKVEAKPHPRPWEPARVGEQLFEQDGVRTYRRSSAELAFDDGASVVVTEDSLLFIRDVGHTVARGRHESIEVVEGQADLEARVARAAQASDIEVIVGDMTAEPKPGDAGLARSRLRRAERGVAEVMVFDGSTKVAAGGQEVEVPAGMGTAVPDGGVPRAPEQLLAAPVAVAPQPGQRFAYANPRFSWQAVAGAVAYTVEVCADSSCGELVERVTGLSDTIFQPAALVTGDLYWRVTARAASGLDGFPSPPRPLGVDSDRVDVMAPAVAVVADRPALATSAGGVVVPPESHLTVVAHDDAAGVRELSARWDGGEWFAVSRQSLQTPGEPGVHALELKAVDELDRVSPPTVVQVLVDGNVPAAPVLAVSQTD